MADELLSKGTLSGNNFAIKGGRQQRQGKNHSRLNDGMLLLQTCKINLNNINSLISRYVAN